MQVAGGGRVKQQDPRHVAVVLFPKLLHIIVAREHSLIGQIQRVHFQNVRVDLVDGPVGKLHPFAVGVRHKGTYCIPVGLGKTMAQQRLGQIDQPHGILRHLFRTFAPHGMDGGVQRLAERSAFGGVYNRIHRHSNTLLFLQRIFD